MFLKSNRSYDRYGSQKASGPFLMVFNKDKELRACVRHVRMSQCGHFMMGQVQLGPFKITLSGTYGSDGLPKEPPEGLWEHLIPLPEELTQEFWKGGGWNSAGSEAESMVDWAKNNLTLLRRPIKRGVVNG